jgi:hypothetical protein
MMTIPGAASQRWGLASNRCRGIPKISLYAAMGPLTESNTFQTAAGLDPMQPPGIPDHSIRDSLAELHFGIQADITPRPAPNSGAQCASAERIFKDRWRDESDAHSGQSASSIQTSQGPVVVTV